MPERHTAVNTPLMVVNLKSKYSELNPAMRQIADYILANPGQAAYMGISQLAKASHVSVASVTRFVKELGFANYKTFQFEFARGGGSEPVAAEETKQDNTITFEYAGASLQDGAEVITRKVFQSNIQMLADSMLTLDYDLVEKVSQKILAARNVLLFGVGRSYLAAESARTRLYRLGITCLTYVDVHEQLVAATTCTPEDVVIGISNFGRSASVVTSMELAKKRGAYTVGITSAAGSPIAKAVDDCFLTAYNYANIEYRNDNRQYEPACENITQLALLDSIYMNVALRCGEQVMEDFYTTAREQDKERL